MSTSSPHKSTEYLVDAVQGKTPIFVAGATGFVGREVVAALASQGETVVAHIRPDSGQVATWRERFAAMDGRIIVDMTPWELRGLTATLALYRPSAVYFLIGTTRHAAKRADIRGDIYQVVDVALCRMLANATAALATPVAAPVATTANAPEASQSPNSRFILLSSVGAGPSRSAYLQARHDMEASVRAAGLSATVFRPSVITGARDETRLGETMAATIGDALLVLAGAVSPRTRARFRSIAPGVLARQLADARSDTAPWRVVEAESIARI